MKATIKAEVGAEIMYDPVASDFTDAYVGKECELNG